MPAQAATGAEMGKNKDSGTLDNEAKYFRYGFDSVITVATIMNQVLLDLQKMQIMYIYIFLKKCSIITTDTLY